MAFDIAQSARALRVLERLASEVLDAVQDAATDLELLAPDEEVDPSNPPVSTVCRVNQCTRCQMPDCDHRCHTDSLTAEGVTSG